MNLLKTAYLFSALLFFTGVNISYGQTLDDALRMSLRDYKTSARVVGTGSAMGAIGGDYGAVNINPANIGTFRNSYFTFSLGMNSINTNSQWRESSTSDESLNSNFFLPNIGFVTTSELRGKWETISFGLGLNRVRGNSSTINTSSNSRGSIAERWAYLANQIGDPDNFGSFEVGPAWNSYALGVYEDPEGNVIYTSDYGSNDFLDKSVYEEVNGGVNEIALTLGGNYDNKLLLGMNLGLPIYKNQVNYTYTESDSDPDNLYKSILFEESYETSGLGFNFGLGAIYMPIYKLRFGFSFQSPTWYGLNENYNTRVKFDYYDPDNEIVPDGTDTDIESENGIFEYSFTTPWRVGAQVGWIVGKFGFIDIDVEYINYASSKFDLGSFLQEERYQNNLISDELGSALSINAGGEIAVDEFRFRAGLGLQQDPYINSNDFERSYSAGIGFRGESFYLDLAYRYQKRNGTFYPYLTFEDIYQPRIDNEYTNNNFILSIGFNI